MKRFCYILFIGLLLTIACRRQDIDPDIPVTGLTLSDTELTLEIGKIHQLSATVLPADATNPVVSWQSSAPAVALVTEEGLIKTVSEGSATITAKAGSIEASCHVTVKKPFIAVSSVTLDHRSLVLPVGRTRVLGVSVLPANATDPTVSWSSSAPAVITVADDGTVTAVAEGTAVITASAGGLKALCDVIVIPEGPEENEIWYTSWLDDGLSFGSEEGCGARIVSNVYANGKGVISFDREVVNIPTVFFKANSGLKTLSLAHTVKTLAAEAFRDCSTMLNISLQEGLTQIGDSAFERCYSLRKIIFPSTLVSLGKFVFRNCSSITALTLPENVSNLDDFALYGCSKLESLTILRTKPASLGFRALDETNDCPIYVPAASVDAYKKADGWKEYASRIQAIKE